MSRGVECLENSSGNTTAMVTKGNGSLRKASVLEAQDQLARLIPNLELLALSLSLPPGIPNPEPLLWQAAGHS